MLRKWLVLLALGLTACRGAPAAEGPSASVTAPPRNSTTTTAEALTPEEEVEVAYLRSWDVYTRAVRTLDPAGLEKLYAGEQLERTRAAVVDYRTRKVAVQVSVEHDYDILIPRPGFAIVRDTYRNHSVLVDPDTGEPREPDPNDRYTETYTLQQIEGTWKVTDIARA